MVGLGANLGDRIATFQRCLEAIARVPGLDILARSRVYETAPVGDLPQPSFLNAALLLRCALVPLHLLRELLRIEIEQGRVRGPGEVRFGPRTLDLDILWIDGAVVDEPGLVVPHPRMHERAFAVIPLLDVVPDAVDPRTGGRVVAPARGDVVLLTTLRLA